MTVEFDCDIEGDADDGWQDDLEDDSMNTEESPQQQQPAGGEEEDEDESDEDMAGPGKENNCS